MSIDRSIAKRGGGALLLLAGDFSVRPSLATEKIGVLFIASHDMRPKLGCYGDPTVMSSNLDPLAKRGMVFNRSCVQPTLRSPSRISMLSGRDPKTMGIFEIGRPLWATMPNVTTLPQKAKVIESLSRRMQENFPLRDFQEISLGESRKNPRAK